MSCGDYSRVVRNHHMSTDIYSAVASDVDVLTDAGSSPDTYESVPAIRVQICISTNGNILFDNNAKLLITTSVDENSFLDPGLAANFQFRQASKGNASVNTCG